MAFRFRRSLRLGPGLRLNFGKRGMSISAGVRGASITAGSRRVHANVGLPGTGMSVRWRLDQPSRRARRGVREGPALPDEFSLYVAEDGSTELLDRKGVVLPAPVQAVLRREQREAICDALHRHASTLKAQRKAMLEVHRATPPPSVQPPEPELTLPAAPQLPRLPTASPWQRFVALFSSRARRALADRLEEHRRLCHEIQARWKAEVRTLTAAADRAAQLRIGAAARDPAASSSYLEYSLKRLAGELPASITAVFEPRGTARVQAVLPGRGELPPFEVSVLVRRQRLKLRPLSDTALRKDHMSFVHGAGFRILGEAFARVPAIRSLVLLASVDEPNPTTGRLDRHARYSVRVDRAAWSRLDFEHLDRIDPVVSLATFDMRRKMTKTGIFKEITPHSPDAPVAEGLARGTRLR